MLGAADLVWVAQVIAAMAIAGFVGTTDKESFANHLNPPAQQCAAPDARSARPGELRRYVDYLAR